MTPAALKALIESSPEAMAAVAAGNDTLTAQIAASIAPKEIRETLIGELGIFKLAADPTTAETIMQTVEAVADANPVVKRMLKWMQPGAPGIDFGDTRVRTMLTAPLQDGGLGLAPEVVAPILAATEHEPTITAADVAAAMHPPVYREEVRAADGTITVVETPLGGAV